MLGDSRLGKKGIEPADLIATLVASLDSWTSTSDQGPSAENSTGVLLANTVDFLTS